MPVCKNCDKEFPNWTTIEGRRKNLSTRKYCLQCSPWGEHNTRKLGRHSDSVGGKKAHPRSEPDERSCSSVETPSSMALELPKDLHSKKKGDIGELAVALVLSRLGYSVFSELGDVSSIDLIAEKKGQLIRIQCKALMPVNAVLKVPVRSSTTAYRMIYDDSMVDYIAACDLSTSEVYLIPIDEANEVKSFFAIRLRPSVNRQVKGTRSAQDYRPEAILKE